MEVLRLEDGILGDGPEMNGCFEADMLLTDGPKMNPCRDGRLKCLGSWFDCVLWGILLIFAKKAPRLDSTYEFQKMTLFFRKPQPRTIELVEEFKGKKGRI